MEHLPDFLKNLISMTPKARAEKLHKEYFDIEQAEQKRLQRVLDWHCQQSVVVDYKVAEKEKEKAEEKRRKMLKAQEMKVDGESHEDGKDDDDATYHPFSISAGVEKGHLNRYKNMWPVSSQACTELSSKITDFGPAV